MVLAQWAWTVKHDLLLSLEGMCIIFTPHHSLNLLNHIPFSDTTSATLANIFFYTARDQEIQRKLREEVDALYSAFDGDEDKLFEALGRGGCPGTKYLEGVMRESLRINTAFPGSPQRMAPPEGLTIDGTYVPGGTAIYLSQFTTARGAVFCRHINLNNVAT